MAFTASAVWEVETGGNDANGGGFDCGVSGFPTDGTVDANTGNTTAPVFSSASYNFVAGDVGAWVFIKSGTNSIPGWYKISSVASNKATLDGTIGHAVLFGGGSAANTSPNLRPSTAAGLSTVGTPTNLTWGIDYSQGTSPIITYTDMVIGGTTTQFTSAGNPVNKRLIGNVINVTSGTGFTVQRVAVVSTSGTTATCDKSLGTAASTGGNGKLGGCFASPGQAAALMISNNCVTVKAGTYTIASASTNIATGCISSSQTNVLIQGYGTVRGDLDSMSVSPSSCPLLQASGISTFTMITMSGGGTFVRNFQLDGATLTSSRGCNISNGMAMNLFASNCTNTGLLVGILYRGSATGCTTAGAGISISNTGRVMFAESYSNTVTGFSMAAAQAAFCLSYDNSGASSDGFNCSSPNCSFHNCVAYNNGRVGFRNSSQSPVHYVNCIAEANASNGFQATTGGAFALFNCGVYNNGTDTSFSSDDQFVNLGLVTASSSFFTSASGHDFSLNNTAGAGVLARGAGIPGVFPRATTTGYIDIGAVERQDSVTGGSVTSVPFIGMFV